MAGTLQPTIFTDRLVLDKLKADDSDFIYALVNSKGWLNYIGDRNVHTQKDALIYINKILATENLIYWVVRLKNDNTPIGIISFIKRTYLEKYDIGFALLPYFSNKGYAYEASKAVLQSVTRLPEHNIVLATTKYSNKSSVKLLTKLGFHFDRQIEIENEKLQVYKNGVDFKGNTIGSFSLK